jgi:ABC-type Fe3+-hydroxamate transport system substrate-binding protein
MIGSPTTDMDSSVTAAKAKKVKPTHVVVKTLMIPGLAPGRIVVLDAANFDGNYQIVQCDYIGDSGGNDWFCNLKLSPY